jgi:hypothetical protein
MDCPLAVECRAAQVTHQGYGLWGGVIVFGERMFTLEEWETRRRKTAPNPSSALVRVCALEGCENTFGLAGHAYGRKYCSDSCKQRVKRAQNLDYARGRRKARAEARRETLAS